MENDNTQAAYNERVLKIGSSAEKLASSIIDPQVSGGQIITDSAERVGALKESIKTKESVFDSAGNHKGFMVGSAANAVSEYYAMHGEMPSAELMASMNQTIENMLGEEHTQAILDNASSGAGSSGISSSEGIVQRNRQVALVVPVQLMMITNDMVTHIPAQFNKAEIFHIRRVADSTFGDLKAGDVIDTDFSGQYSSMDQRKLMGSGNGTEKTFSVDYGMALVKGKVRILVDRNPCANDDTRSDISGKYHAASDKLVRFNGGVDYATGKVHVTFDEALPNGIEVHVIADVSIEKNPNLIPTITHEIESFEVYPHEAALACSNTIQSQFTGKREFNIDISSMQLGASRNVLAAEKDRKRLNDIYFYAKGEKEFNITIPQGLDFRQHYAELEMIFRAISAELMSRTKRSGLEGIVAGREASTILKTVGAPHLQLVNNYRQIPQPHFVGRIFGYKFKEDPQMGDPWRVLCYAKGTSHGDAGYVAGDAIAATNFPHSIGKSLKHENTLYELSYRDLHPHNGRDWFMWLKLVKKPR